jgi:hypothetical protein
MSSLLAADKQAEVVALHSEIHNLLKSAQQKAVARRQQEKLFLLSFIHEATIGGSTHPMSPELDEVAQLLRDNGEEELIEDDCLHRYELFISSKATVFRHAVERLQNSINLLSKYVSKKNLISGIDISKIPSLGCPNAPCTELQELCVLCEATSHMHRLTSAESAEHLIPFSVCDNTSVLAENEKLAACEMVIRETSMKHQNDMSATTARLQTLERELAQLEVEDTQDTGCREDSSVSADSNGGDSALAVAEGALDALQSTTESWMKRKQRLDAAEVAVRGNLDTLMDRVAAYRRAIDTLATSAGDIEGAAAYARKECIDLAQELNKAECNRTELAQLLVETEASYNELRRRTSRVAEDDLAKAGTINDAEFERRELVASTASAEHKLARLEDDNANIAVLLKEVRSDKEVLSKSIQYLEGLVSDKNGLKELQSSGFTNENQTCSSQATHNYLNFVQRAREHQRRHSSIT